MHKLGVAASGGRRVYFGPGLHASLTYSNEDEFLENIAEDLDLTEIEVRFREVEGIRTWDVYGTHASECGSCC